MQRGSMQACAAHHVTFKWVGGPLRLSIAPLFGDTLNPGCESAVKPQ